LGVEFTKKEHALLEDMKEEVQKAHNRGIPPDAIFKILYTQRDRYLFRKRSSFSALTTPEWLARIVQCSDNKKREIEQLTYWIDGTFTYESETKDHIMLCHLQSKEVFPIRKDSFQKGKTPKLAGEGLYAKLHAVKWNGEYNMSGAFLATPMTEKDILKEKSQPYSAPWMMTDETLKASRESTDNMHSAFLEYFKSPMAIFNNQIKLQKEQMAFVEFYNSKLKAKESFWERSKRFLQQSGQKENYLDLGDLGHKNDVALFFVEGEGTQIINDVRGVIHRLTSKNLTKREQVDLYISLANGFHPQVVTFLLETYGSDNLKFPFDSDEIDMKKALPFFWRMNSPEEFDPVYPMMTMVEGLS
jgi:hypothetical protein